MKKIILTTKQEKRKKLHRKIRSKINGNDVIPRLFVFKSNRFIYAGLINDESGKMIGSSSDMKTFLKDKINKIDSAKKVGVAIADIAKKSGYTKVVFDRGGFPFKGRISSLAEGAREAGLQF